MTATESSATIVQMRKRHIRGNLFRLMAEKSLYPLVESSKRPEKKLVGIELTPEEKADIQLVADLFNAMDHHRGVKRDRKWERKSVLEHFARSSLQAFWGQIGGRPETTKLRDDAVKAAIASLEALEGRTPKKK